MEEIPGDTASGGDHAFAGAEAQNVTFAYEDETILDQYSLNWNREKSPASTARAVPEIDDLKLLMRFWDVQTGRVPWTEPMSANPDEASARYGKLCDAGDTSVPRFDCEQYRYCKTRRERGKKLWKAAKKASIHDFIMTLPKRLRHRSRRTRRYAVRRRKTADRYRAGIPA